MKTCSRYSFNVSNNEISEIIQLKRENCTVGRKCMKVSLNPVETVWVNAGTAEAAEPRWTVRTRDYTEVLWEHVFLACQVCQGDSSDSVCT